MMRIHLGSKEGWSGGTRDVGCIQIPFFKLLIASIRPRFRTFDWAILIAPEEMEGAKKLKSLSLIVPIERQRKKFILRGKRFIFDESNQSEE